MNARCGEEQPLPEGLLSIFDVFEIEEESDLRVVDFIARYIEDRGMTQSEAAAVVGWSRQNFWDKLNNRNPRYRTVQKILKAFGFELRITRADEKAADFDEAEFWRIADEKNVSINTLEDIANAMGCKFDVVNASDISE